MIVSDSTTLIILNDLKRLDLLENLFNRLYIPQKVHEEVCIRGCNFPAFIHMKEIQKDERYSFLCNVLDEGESEAITLAKQLCLPLIIDEKKGRKIAKNLGIQIIGFLGVVYINYQKGFVSKREIENILDNAIKKGYRISQKLTETFLASLQ